MARRPEATREAVWEAMERLRAAGDPRWDSPMRLRVAIGSVGSFSTITQHRDAWREAHKSIMPAVDTPCEVPTEARDMASDAIAKAVEQAWRTARDHAAAATEDIRRKSLAEVTAAQRDRDDALEEARRLEHAFGEAQDAISEQKNRATKAEKLAEDLSAANAGLRSQLEQALLVMRQQQESAAQATSESSAREHALRDEIARSTRREDDLKNELAAVKARLHDVEATCTHQTQRLSDIERELATAEATAHHATQRAEAIEKDLCTTEDRVAELEQQILSLRQASLSTSEENTRLSERNKILEFAQEKSERKGAESADRILKLEVQLETLRRSESTLKHQLAGEVDKAAQQESQLSNIAKTLAQLADRL